MYEQAEPVRSPFSGPYSPQPSRPPPQPRSVQQSGSRGRVRHGNGDSDKQREDQDTSSHTYENAEEVKRYATSAAGYANVPAPVSTWCDSQLHKSLGHNPPYVLFVHSTQKHMRRVVTEDGAYPGGASARRGVCSFLRARRSCLAAGFAVVLGLVAVGLAPLTISNKQEISLLKRDQDDVRRLSATVDALKSDQDTLRRLSATVDALKRDQDGIFTAVDDLKRVLEKERSRIATLEQRLHRKSLLSCPEGYTMWRKICYKAFDTWKTFSDAAAACRADGGTLAMPRDADTNAFLIFLHNSVRNDQVFWFGLHDQREEGKFEWMDGSALGPYSSWGQGRPDNLEGNQDCVIYSKFEFDKDKWNDEECHDTFRFICQVAPGCA
ncbi:hypothetical protein Bbelb_283090 [Branchiostoma belcheri]|nr:hypothetical protein Bbelb_283090 [Branchiostoma belcheri]